MADPQDPPGSEPDGASTPPPEKKPPAKAAKKVAKAPAKKAPAKKAPAKKAPAKKAPAKKAPAKAVEPPLEVRQRIETNGDLAAAAKDVAAQAKSTVDAANDPVSPNAPAAALTQSPLPLIVALAVSLLAILLIRQLRRR
ncbi:nucleoid-structuring protein H-NS [Mycobacterium sp. 852002-53434_SCH5985345]|uniref:Rv3852 family protein n=1 Tax=Mycobacterium sp. 852002-53434_SCH5985345 TaxID=1834107 RepID=UPI00080221D0|nr:nucleoid-structuring protein H-NS [Mycobacterium sp. 852002-53434_SCH5985345]OBF54279.1 nucleoid-structuring protein H-NS [Mycobacterium sp. 852002-53434_SCH5985345]